MLDKKTMALVNSITVTDYDKAYPLTAREADTIIELINTIEDMPWKEVAYNPDLKTVHERGSKIISNYTVVEDHEGDILQFIRHMESIDNKFLTEMDTNPAILESTEYDITITMYGKSVVIPFDADSTQLLQYALYEYIGI